MENWKERFRNQFVDTYGEKDSKEWRIAYQPIEELEDFISQELDKAREDVLIELQKEFSEFGVPDDVRYTQPLFYINGVIEKKLSKLKDNK